MQTSFYISSSLHRIQVVEVNGINLANVSHAQAVQALQSNPTGVTLKVARLANPHGTNEVIEDIMISRSATGFGFSIAGGLDAPLTVCVCVCVWYIANS